MKKIKYYIFFLLGAAMIASCDNELTEDVKMGIRVDQNDGVSMQGDVVTVKAGTPVVFNFSGEPDNIMFYSGEPGAVYAHRQRTEVAPEDIESAILHFKIGTQYGKTYENTLEMLVSDQFEGLAKNDFKKDSVLVEQFAWNELVAKSELPDKPSIQKEYTVDVTKYLGKPMTLAIHYQAIDDTKNSMPRYNFSEMYIENVRKDGIVSKFMPSQYGFTAVNMMCNHHLKSQAGMKTNREYGTMTNNTAGIWNVVNAQNGGFYIAGGGKNTGNKNGWLISDGLITTYCDPDQGTVIKNITQNVESYTHTYNKVGEYKATFIATRVNYKHDSRMMKELTIKVVE